MKNISQAKCLKAMKISPSEEISYVDFHLDGRDNSLIHGKYAMALEAGDYEGLKLALFSQNDDKKEINIVGSAIASYMKDPYYIYPILIKGPVIIVDDDGDMNIEKYQLIKSIINLKKLKKIPDKLKNNLIITEEDMINVNKEDFNLIINKIKKKCSDGIKNYGLKVGKFPKWI